MTSHGTRGDGRRRVMDDDLASVIVVAGATHQFRELSPLPRQIQPLIAKFAVGNGSGDPLAFLRPFKSKLHPPFHQPTTSNAGFCSTSDIGSDDGTGTH